MIIIFYHLMNQLSADVICLSIHSQIEEDISAQFLMNFFDDSPYFRVQSRYTGICIALDTAVEASQGWKGFGSEIGIPQNQTLDWIDHFTRRSLNSPSPGATLLDFFLKDIEHQDTLQKLQSLKRIFTKIDNNDAKMFVEQEIADRIKISDECHSGKRSMVSTSQLSENNHNQVMGVTITIQPSEEDIPGTSESVANHGNDSGLSSLDGRLKVNNDTEQISISSADETNMKEEKPKKVKRKKTFRQRIKNRSNKFLNRKSMRKELLEPPRTNLDQKTASDGNDNVMYVNECEQPDNLVSKSIRDCRVKKSTQNAGKNDNLSDECAGELTIAEALEVSNSSHRNERKVSKQSIMSKDSGIDSRPQSMWSNAFRLSSYRQDSETSLGSGQGGLHSVPELVEGTTVMYI